MLRLDVLHAHSHKGFGLKVGISANNGAHTDELIGGVCLSLQDALKAGSQVARSIELVWKDDGRDPVAASAVAEEYKREGIRFVVGHLSASASLASSCIYSSNNMFLFAPGTSHPALCGPGKRGVYRICAQDDTQADLLAAFIQSSRVVSSVVLIRQDNSYGIALGDLISKRLTALAVSHKLFSEGDIRTRAISDEGVLCEPDPSRRSNDFVVISGIHEFVAEISDRIIEMGFSGTIIGGDDCFCDNFRRLKRHHTTPTIGSRMAFEQNPSANMENDNLNLRYEALIGCPPGAYFQTSYVAFDTLLGALERTGSGTSADIERYLGETLIQTRCGSFRFDGEGNALGLNWNLWRLDERKSFSELESDRWPSLTAPRDGERGST